MNHKLIIALGNPGEQFEHTRHNLGKDMVLLWVNYIAEQGAQVSEKKSQEKLHATSQDILFQDSKITILFPDIFMNESGKAVAQYLRYNDIDPRDIIVIHDDLELQLGDVKYQESGSAHGHNGMRSIHDYVGDTDIAQLRIGIGRPQQDAMPIEKFVLERFMPEELGVLQAKQGDSFTALSNFIEPNQHLE
ncbi:MAG: aminoacyl-tRNA hydrolase [Candidatus Andersenbacteria bacterium]